MSTDRMPLDLIVLHYALKNKKFMLEIGKSIKSHYFKQEYGVFYSVLRQLVGDKSTKDLPTLNVLLAYCAANNINIDKSIFAKIHQAAIAITINAAVPQDNDFPYFIDLLKKRHNEQVLKELIGNIEIGEKTDIKDLNKVIDRALKEINSIYSGEVFDEGSVGADAENMRNEYKFIAKDPDSFKGVLSGYQALDSLTNGFFGGELIIIAGFEGTGKSILCHNFAVNAWLGSNRPNQKEFTNDGSNVVYFTLEMPRSNRGEFTSGAYLNKRIISCISGVQFSDIRKGSLLPEDETTFNETCDFIKKYDEIKKFYVVDIPRGATLADIESKYLELKGKFPIDLIVIDYLGLMEGAGDSEDPDWHAIGKIAAGLHEFARNYNVPVVSPVQVNRPTGTNQSFNKQNYNVTRIGRSAMITQNANIVLQIGCRDQEEQYPDMPIYIIKMRDAPKGIITFTKDFGRMRVLGNNEDGLNDNSLAEFESLSIGE